jgi:hypothetical protein
MGDFGRGRHLRGLVRGRRLVLRRCWGLQLEWVKWLMDLLARDLWFGLEPVELVEGKRKG